MSTAALLDTCRSACDTLSVMVSAIYGNDALTTTKQDKSAFTLADGLVQAMEAVGGAFGPERAEELAEALDILVKLEHPALGEGGPAHDLGVQELVHGLPSYVKVGDDKIMNREGLRYPQDAMKAVNR